MANVKKSLRVQDTDIKRLNHIGLGLKTIANLLGCHPATVTIRLKEMNMKPTDTRRSFMEQVFMSLTRDEQDWLSHNLYNAGIGVKEFVTTLIKEAYANASNEVAAIPAPMPKLLSGDPKGPADVAPEDAALVHEVLVAVEPEKLVEVPETPATEVLPEKTNSLFE